MRASQLRRFWLQVQDHPGRAFARGPMGRGAAERQPAKRDSVAEAQPPVGDALRAMNVVPS
jgi:hypothetical protein